MVRRDREPVLRRRSRRRRDEDPGGTTGAIEESLELALEAGGMGVWSADPVTGSTEWSESMERLAGLEPGTFGGTIGDAVDLVHPDDRDLVVERVARTESGIEPTGLHYRIVRPDGTVRWIDNRSRRLADGSLLGVAVDVTEQHEIEDELRNREAEARLALDAGRMGSWRWERATNEMFWSPEMEAVFGLDRGAHAGTFNGYVERISAEDRARVLAVIGGAVDGGNELAVEHRIARADGQVRWVECRGQAVPDTGGMQWIGVAIDVTERKETDSDRARLLALEQMARGKAEQVTGELEETLARLDTLLEHAPVGFGFYDTAFRYVRLNQPLADMNGLPLDAHIGRTVAELFPELWDAVGPLFRSVVETGDAVIDREVSAQTPAAPGITRHWLRSIYPVFGRGGELVGTGSVVVEITERKRAELATRLIAAASELFTSSLDLDTMLDRAVRLAIPAFADSCHVYLIDPHGDGRRVAMADVDRALEPLLIEADRRFPADLEGDLPTATALRTGRTRRVEVVTDEMRTQMARSPEHLELLRRHGVCSVIATPVAVRGEHLGVLLLTYTETSKRRYQPEDVPLAEELSRGFAEAIDRARLFEEAQRARARLDLLARVGELLTVELDSRARLAALPQLVIPAFADVCAVHVMEHDAALPDSGTPWGRAVTSGEAVVVGEVPTAVAEQLAVAASGQPGTTPTMDVRSIVSVPLPGPDGPIGAVSFAYGSSGRRYGPDDVTMAQELARRAAPAVENALRFEQERATALSLQRSLLPERLPEVPEAEVAARYLPGSAELEIGGDWYDVLPLPGGRVLVAIGDVVGHGIRAASSMGKIRNALHFCAREGLSPGAILQRLNEHFCGLDDPDMATLLVLVYDPSEAVVRFSSAGHPPPLVQRPGREPEYLPGGRGAPLCASDRARYPELEAPLPPGSLLLLYTDGLIERRGESLDIGLHRLADALGAAPEKVEELADHVLAALLGDAAPGDDVALIAARALAPAPGLDLRLPARPRELGILRERLRDWLVGLGAAPTEAGEIAIAVNEAAANAVEHAYGLADADFSVEARVDQEAVVVRVRDAGQWREPPVHGRGRGLDLMRGLMDEASVDSGPDGTTVMLRRRLRGEVEDE
ncbi:MAG: SpoIIE family protein phosphatase [Acidimicrobiia bacterium]